MEIKSISRGQNRDRTAAAETHNYVYINLLGKPKNGVAYNGKINVYLFALVCTCLYLFVLVFLQKSQDGLYGINGPDVQWRVAAVYGDEHDCAMRGKMDKFQ